MNTNLRMGNRSWSVLAMLCIACGLAACTTSESNSPGTGGTSGGGSGGTTSSTTGLGTLCPPPQQVITDFTYTPSDASTDTTAVRFGSAGTLQGGESFYPGAGSTYPLTSSVTQSNWHISGTVGDYSGFALYFDNGSSACDRVDASAFKGISFAISGSVPHGSNAITMGVGTAGDTPSGTWMLNTGGKTTAKPTDVGRCTPTSGTQYYHPGCGDPTTQISITSASVTQNVTWATLTGGTPEASPNPSEITSIYWFFPWTGSTDTTYAVDITLDDLKFMQ